MTPSFAHKATKTTDVNKKTKKNHIKQFSAVGHSNLSRNDLMNTFKHIKVEAEVLKRVK